CRSRLQPCLGQWARRWREQPFLLGHFLIVRCSLSCCTPPGGAGNKQPEFRGMLSSSCYSCFRAPLSKLIPCFAQAVEPLRETAGAGRNGGRGNREQLRQKAIDSGAAHSTANRLPETAM